MASPKPRPPTDEERDDALSGVHYMVWTGFFSPEEIVEELREHFEALDPFWLRQAVDAEWEKKLDDETTWPAETDCDRLNGAFEILHGRGFIATVCSDYTLTSAIETLAEALESEGFDSEPVGHCFACGQDIEAALQGRGLHLAFGDVDDDDAATIALGKQIRSELQRAGFNVEWDETATTRLHITPFEWKNRYVPEAIGEA